MPDAGSAGSSPINELSDLTCPECNYMLRGLTSDRCPECGFELRIILSSETHIPWEQRRSIGTSRAYWQTVHYVIRGRKRFAMERYRALQNRAARAFVWFTALRLGAGALCLALVIAWLPGEYSNRMGLFERIACLVAVPLLMALFVAVVSQPRDCIGHPAIPARVRAAAAIMTDYAVAAFAWLTPAWLIMAGSVAVVRDFVFALPALSAVLLLGATLLYLFTLAATVSRMLPSRAALAAFFAHLWLNWLLLLVLMAASWWVIAYVLIFMLDGRLRLPLILRG